MKNLAIVGASLAGLRAAEAVRHSGFSGEITMIGAEPHLPYDRPPLSKGYLEVDARAPHFRTQEHLTDELGIQLVLGQPATALEPNEKFIAVGAKEIPYDAAVIATGATPRTIPDWSSMAGVVTLRTIDDAHIVRDALDGEARITIIGGGFIGSEIASAARKRGNPVTIVEAADVPLTRAVGREIGSSLSAMHHRYGTDLRCSTTLVGVNGLAGVQSVELSDNSIIATDLLLISIGAAPATDWLAHSGIERSADGGIVCNEFMESSIPGVYAAGDVAYWPNAVMGAPMRLEHWTSAAEQAAVAGRNATAAAAPEAYSTVPYFWSDWYGNRIQFVGKAGTHEAVVVSGSMDQERCTVLYREGSRLVGALTVNEPTRIMKYRRLIAQYAGWEDAIAFAGSVGAQQAVSGVRP